MVIINRRNWTSGFRKQSWAPFSFSSSRLWITILYMSFHLSLGWEGLQGWGWGLGNRLPLFKWMVNDGGLRFPPLGSEYEQSFVWRSSFPLHKYPWHPLVAIWLWLDWSLAAPALHLHDSSSCEGRRDGTVLVSGQICSSRWEDVCINYLT